MKFKTLLLLLLLIQPSPGQEFGRKVGQVASSEKFGECSIRLDPDQVVFEDEIYVFDWDKPYIYRVWKTGSGWALLIGMGRAESPPTGTACHAIPGRAEDVLPTERRREHGRLVGLLHQRDESQRDWILKRIVENNPYDGDSALYVARELSIKGEHESALRLVSDLKPETITMEFGQAELSIIKARSLFFTGHKAEAGREMLKNDAYAIPRASHLGWTTSQMSWLQEAIGAASGAFKL